MTVAARRPSRRALTRPAAAHGLAPAWGGLQGALSLAPSIPKGPAQGVILSTTFAVVIFSVLAQGLTFGRIGGRHAGTGQAAGPQG